MVIILTLNSVIFQDHIQFTHCEVDMFVRLISMHTAYKFGRHRPMTVGVAIKLHHGRRVNEGKEYPNAA